MNYLSDFFQLLSVFAVAIISVLPIYSLSTVLAPFNSLLVYCGSALALSLTGSLLTFAAGIPTHPVILVMGLILMIIYFRLYRIGRLPILTFFTWTVTMVLFIYRICMLAVIVRYPKQFESRTLRAYALSFLVCALIAVFGFLLSSRKTESLASNTNIQKSVWVIASIISVIFILLNLTLSLQTSRIQQNQLFMTFFLGYVLFTFFLYVLMCVVYVIIAEEYADNALLREENRLRSVQDMQYETLMKDMQQQAEFRHDVKHTMATLRAMLEENDVKGAAAYIDQYTKDIPLTVTKNYCPLPSLNAVLNYYDAQAKALPAKSSFQIYLPTKINMEDSQLCSLVGNILENALEALALLPEEERSLQFSLLLKNEASLYIVSTNTFNGEVKRIGERYLSTKRNSGGIGTRSMITTVRKCDGTINLHHTDREFFVDIFIPVKEKTANL